MSLTFPLTATTHQNFDPPPSGLHPAVLVKVSEPEIMEGEHGPRAVIRLTFEIGAKRRDGRRHRLTRIVSASLHPKSKLAEILDRWLGRCPDSFEPSLVLGRRAMLVVHHAVGKDGTTFAKIASIQPSDPCNPVRFEPDL